MPIFELKNGHTPLQSVSFYPYRWYYEVDMRALSRRDWLFLVFGDLVVLVVALYVTLVLRYLTLPEPDLFVSHLIPFSFLSIAWILVFIIAGLYEKQTSMMRLQLPDMILRAQMVNVLLAAAFFFLIPYFGITPKTNLVIFLILSSLFLIFWRLVLFPHFGFKKREKAVLLGTGKEIQELYEEVKANNRYAIDFVCVVDVRRGGNPNDVQRDVLKRITKDGVTMVVTDMRDKEVDLILPLLYNLSFVQAKIDIVDMATIYEDVFERIPISLIGPEWFVEHVSTDRYTFYDFLKRLTDILAGAVLGVLSLVFYPFVWVAVMLDDGGPLFVTQERVGQSQRPITIAKFRTMSGASSDTGNEVLNSKKTITRVGKFLRDFRIDELPQLWSVLTGQQSLIGPRPELPALVQVYTDKIPHYTSRSLVAPGLSGWAQIHHQAHPHHGTDITETKVKLAYDLYYIKHRSFFLDLLIALRTIQIILSRVGK